MLFDLWAEFALHCMNHEASYTVYRCDNSFPTRGIVFVHADCAEGQGLKIALCMGQVCHLSWVHRTFGIGTYI